MSDLSEGAERRVRAIVWDATHPSPLAVVMALIVVLALGVPLLSVAQDFWSDVGCSREWWSAEFCADLLESSDW